MKKLFYVYVIGNICNTCYVKLAKNEKQACEFFEKLGYTVKSVYLAESFK